MGTKELTICELTKQYKSLKAVNNVSLTLTPGVWGLLGANGAGKTTLMRMVAGILTPTHGTIWYNGEGIGNESYRAVFGYLPQHFGYYPEFTVQNYLQYVAALKGLSKRKTTIKIDGLLRMLSLGDARKKRIRKLSGGMQRRVGIAQAMLNDPDVLILDEPTSGLDPGERARLRNLIADFATDRIVLISTHIVSDVEHIATCNAIMNAGQIIAVGTTDELVQQIRGKVWSCSIPASGLPALESRAQIVSVRSESADNVAVRYVSDEAVAPGSSAESPQLEDLYLWLFQDESNAREGI